MTLKRSLILSFLSFYRNIDYIQCLPVVKIILPLLKLTLYSNTDAANKEYSDWLGGNQWSGQIVYKTITFEIKLAKSMHGQKLYFCLTRQNKMRYQHTGLWFVSYRKGGNLICDSCHPWILARCQKLGDHAISAATNTTDFIFYRLGLWKSVNQKAPLCLWSKEKVSRGGPPTHERILISKIDF